MAADTLPKPNHAQFAMALATSMKHRNAPIAAVPDTFLAAIAGIAADQAPSMTNNVAAAAAVARKTTVGAVAARGLDRLPSGGIARQRFRFRSDANPAAEQARFLTLFRPEEVAEAAEVHRPAPQTAPYGANN